MLEAVTQTLASLALAKLFVATLTYVLCPTSSNVDYTGGKAMLAIAKASH